MHILVTNDDGVQAPGLLALAQEMRKLGTVTVFAPDHNWSASGHVKTLNRPLRVSEEVLADGRGLLVPFGESDAMAHATLRFLTDTAFQTETRRRAYQYAKPMFWPNVGQRYLELFTRVVSANEARLERMDRRVFAINTERQRQHVGSRQQIETFVAASVSGQRPNGKHRFSPGT